jgi:hypothetical protein
MGDGLAAGRDSTMGGLRPVDAEVSGAGLELAVKSSGVAGGRLGAASGAVVDSPRSLGSAAGAGGGGAAGERVIRQVAVAASATRPITMR